MLLFVFLWGTLALSCPCFVSQDQRYILPQEEPLQPQNLRGESASFVLYFSVSSRCRDKETARALWGRGALSSRFRFLLSFSSFFSQRPPCPLFLVFRSISRDRVVSPPNTSRLQPSFVWCFPMTSASPRVFAVFFSLLFSSCSLACVHGLELVFQKQ